MVVGVNQEAVILQFCDWHAAEAIKRKLIAKRYGKERRDDLINLMWAWIKAPDLDVLEDARDKFILREKELNTIAIEVKESYTILKNYITR
jgi:hypothetical protein